MLMKEKEAHDFICQEMSRAYPGSHATIDSITHCRGSKCAAWEWIESPTVEAIRRRGYCGKSVKPLIEFY